MRKSNLENFKQHFKTDFPTYAILSSFFQIEIFQQKSVKYLSFKPGVPNFFQQRPSK
jgi:hypothetical protein